MRHLNKAYWPYQIVLTATSNTPYIVNDFAPEYFWCRSTIGEQGKTWYSYGNNGSNKATFAFKDKSDLIAFKLRWQQ